jgi:hypothetical protein
MVNEMKYSGHGANSGGLQLHSIGDEYPRMVIGSFNGWKAFNMVSGSYGPERASYKKAKADLKFDAMKAAIYAKIKASSAYSFGYNIYLSGAKVGNPYKVDSDDYGKFGAGFKDARSVEIMQEAADNDYDNRGMVLN